MNPTGNAPRVTPHPTLTRLYHRHARPIQARRPRHSLAPRIMLHLLVGALTLVSAQALLRPFAKSWDPVSDAQIAYAEQQTAASPEISAPSLSTAPQTSPTAAQHIPGRSDVMTDLSASIGRGGLPAVTTWRGVAGLDVNRRAAPNRSKPPIGELKAGEVVEVVRWVSGDEVEPHNNTWAELSDGSYVFSTSLRRAALSAPPSLPTDAPTEGHWVDVNLTQQIATAYDGRTAVRSALISTGRPGWDTPIGVFPVLRRVERDTMDGATLVGQGPNGAGADYKVENVRYVQYFTNDGSAIHENYWRRPATFGMPGSHGCIGMTPADAAWFWSFATVGTPLVIHE
jgi:lipoprotein-anchoring transpeptidase ErfK/SrfK